MKHLVINTLKLAGSIILAAAAAGGVVYACQGCTLLSPAAAAVPPISPSP